MASPPYPVEDQTDEDFFDKLVEEEGGGAGSGFGTEENVDTDDSQTFAKLRIGKVVSVGNDSDSVDAVGGSSIDSVGQIDGVASASGGNLESHGVESAAIESCEASASQSVHESTVHTGGAVGPSNSKDRSPQEGAGVKEVQWSAFDSVSVFNNGNREGSFPDIFSEIGDNTADAYGDLSRSFVAESENEVGVSSNLESVSYNYAQDIVNQQPCVSTPVQTADVQELSAADYCCSQDVVNQQPGVSAEQATDIQDPNNIQYWESLYPGWQYDTNTGQWHEVEGSDATTNTQEKYNYNSYVGGGVNLDRSSEIHLQQTAQCPVLNVTEESTGGNSAYWDQALQGTVDFPPHMVFDPQYPGWYYDTVAQEWKSLESYMHSNQAKSVEYCHQVNNGNATFSNYSMKQNQISYDQQRQVDNVGQHEGQFVNHGSSVNYYHSGSMNMWQPESVSKGEAVNSGVSMQLRSDYNGYWNDSTGAGVGVTASQAATFYEPSNHGVQASNGIARSERFIGGENNLHHYNQHYMEPNHHQHLSSSHSDGSKQMIFPQQSPQNGIQFSGAPTQNRSSAGRPPHALVTFGFGGKLLVMKDDTSFAKSSYGTQDAAGGVINVLHVTEVMSKNDGTGMGLATANYFHSLCQQGFPGPLVSGNAGSKELHKWIDDKVASLSTLDMDFRRVEVMKMLFSLLKIACQCYGKLRSSFGTEKTMQENNSPESSLAKLFASSERDGTHHPGYDALKHCLQNLPSEEQVQATAIEVQKLLVSGRRIDALQCAQEGQLWGPAIVIAAQLGDQYYADTVKQMAVHQLVTGCPLRTLCLLIAGQFAEVFSSSIVTSDQPSGFNISQAEQTRSTPMLDQWEENLAIITANRTKGDELVITHLGDCLWKERGEVTAAHICYLVAEANIESYSDSARLCLVGADHWKYPRTYASPEAIQRTELYEYAKVIGNSQFILLPFQPYKLIYAHMLAEVGKLSDSLKYCQAILKSLKTIRASEVDAWKQLVSSLEERIKIHQQGGFAANLAPAKLVGKLLNLFDSTAHRVVGGLPPPVPLPQSNGHRVEHDHQSRGARVLTSQSTMAMSSLMSSASVEPITEWTGGSSHKSMHNRSMSEPDIGRIPRKGNSPEKRSSSGSQDNTSAPGGASRFGRFGSQLFQKTVGLVLRPRPDRQAKLGETNKFYYDENLKRWVEEGVQPSAEEATLAAPPTTATLMNGMMDHNMKDGSTDSSVPANGEPEYKSPSFSEKSSGIPPIPPSNHFSARGRMGIRARYVDTFNKGGGAPANLFQSPSVPAAKPAGGSAKFFIPTPSVAVDEPVQTAGNTEDSFAEETSSMSNGNGFFSPPQIPASSGTMQRCPSMGNVVDQRQAMVANGTGSHPPHSRRTASWSGSLCDPSNVTKMGSPKSLGEALGFPLSTYMSPDHPASHFAGNSKSSLDELQEVEF